MQTLQINHVRVLWVGLALAVLCLAAIPHQSHAATNSAATLTELKSVLEMLQSNFLRMRAGSTTPATIRASSTKPVVNRTCMQEAVNTRETSIMDAGYEYAFAIRAAMNKRKSAFSTVWSTDDVTKNNRYKQIWTQWKRDSEAARKELTKDRQAAWKTFHDTAAKTCKVKLPKEEKAEQDTSASAV